MGVKIMLNLLNFVVMGHGIICFIVRVCLFVCLFVCFFFYLLTTPTILTILTFNITYQQY